MREKKLKHCRGTRSAAVGMAFGLAQVLTKNEVKGRTAKQSRLREAFGHLARLNQGAGRTAKALMRQFRRRLYRLTSE